MKVLLTGANGQVGRSILDVAKHAAHQVFAYSRDELDITDEAKLKEIVIKSSPDLLINAAAYTAVDKAETEKEKAMAVNRDGPLYLAKICQSQDIPLFHLSTDYVFDGHQKTGYLETDKPQPLNVYGESKYQGEIAIQENCQKYMIIRTSWVFSAYQHNFVKTLLRLMREREVLQVIDDQIGCPTYAGDIAEMLFRLMGQTQWSVYHYAGSPSVSWFAFAQAIYDEAIQYGALKTKKVDPIPSTAYPSKTIRPQHSVLNCDRMLNTFGIEMPDWRDGLKAVVKEVMTCQIG